MSTEATGAAAPGCDPNKPTGLHSPPESSVAIALDGSDSELSDLEDVAAQLRGEIRPDLPEQAPEEEEGDEEEEEQEEDIGEILPDHWSGTVPVFKPTMHQFKDFKRFMEKIDSYGMASGIVKIIPPQEWKDAQPPLDDLVKQIRIREPIKQDIMGSNGTYRQVNILHQRSYNLPQWKQLCEQSEHQPPARRGERRFNAEKPKPAPRTRNAASSAAPKSGAKPGRKRRGRAPRKAAQVAEEEAGDGQERPMTPESPPQEKEGKEEKEEVVASIEQDPGVKTEDPCEDDDDVPVRRMGFSRQAKPKTQSTSARRKYSRREGSAMIDEAAFKDWDYRMNTSEYTPERCEELERIYWKTLTYAPPLYGADLLGSLFDEHMPSWNLNKLPNLLDVLGTKVPGVNTAYLYLGMWKATFAWHLEDVDLYSINYLHFGAPKQWYSISQGDARRFEAAMKNIWPTEAKACDQFLRHKAFLISPAHLKQHYNITVNKCVSYPGEFVVTYPYGYHSGYNLGYNCAEAVNFALDSWLPMGKIAKKCRCAQAQDSVWVDVYEIERKLRGLSTEYEETEDEEEEEEEEEDEDNDTGLPSPPSSHAVKVKISRKRKRAVGDKGDKAKAKKRLRVRIAPYVEPPCCLCPNDFPGAQILPTDDGRKAHRVCALYIPETYIETVDDKEIIANVAGISKARLDLKCLFCRSRKGACFQCSQKKCPRAYHATCAAAAGVFVEEADVPVYGEDGTEYKEQAFEFSCRFHRTKRDRKLDGSALEEDERTIKAAAALKKDDLCQMQYYRGDIFAGIVVENRHDEQTLLLEIVPSGDRVEIEWKWLLLPDPAEYRLPKASANAIPMPTTRKAKEELNATRPADETPRKDKVFVEGYTWSEFHLGEDVQNPEQIRVDLSKDNQMWYYLAKTSTVSKAQYTEDLARPQHNPKSNFLDSIPRPAFAIPAPRHPRNSYATPHGMAGQRQRKGTTAPRSERPYVYKPRSMAVNPQFITEQLGPVATPPIPQSVASGQAQAPSHQYHQPNQALNNSQGQRSAAPPPPSHSQLPSQLHSQPQRPQQLSYAIKQQPLAFGTDPNLKSPSTFSSNRFASVGGSNGFPQIPGLTWPPAHMKSGHPSQPSQPRGWFPPSTTPATSWPYATPMTSSALKSPSHAHPQPDGSTSPRQLSTYQKYSFFQVHHNRDSCRYRTPYAAWGGFTNGYEGNLRAFLIKAQQALSGNKDPIKAIPPSLLKHLHIRNDSRTGSSTPSPQHHRSSYGQALSQTSHPGPSSSLQSPHEKVNPDQVQYSPPSSFQQVFSLSTPPATSSSIHGEDTTEETTCLHPAIRPQYASSFQQSRNTSPQGQPTSNLPEQSRMPPTAAAKAPAPAPAPAPAFTKQSTSPIPLPSYVKKARLPSQGEHTPSPLSRSMPQESSGEISPLRFSENEPAVVSETQPSEASRPQHVQAVTQGVPGLNYAYTMTPSPMAPSTAQSPQTLPLAQNSQELQPQHQPQFQPQEQLQAQHQHHIQPRSQPLYYYDAPPSPAVQPLDEWDVSRQSYISPPPREREYTQTPAEPTVSAASAALVEKMMLNLRRASEKGVSAS